MKELLVVFIIAYLHNFTIAYSSAIALATANSFPAVSVWRGETAYVDIPAAAKATADKAADKRGTGEWGMNDHPLREENYVKVIGSPEFPKGAKLEVCLDRINKIDRIKRAAPEQENPVNPVNPVKKESVLRIKIPKADGNPDSRIAVRPCSSLGTKGKALGATWRG